MNKFSKFPADVICELHPLFKGLLWVSAARSNDETRAVLANVLVERDGMTCHLVATDGRRLHHHEFDAGLFDTDIDMIEPGQYEVITKTAKLIVIAPCAESYNYPNWRLVVPDHVPQYSASVNSQTISRLGIATGVLLAADFVNDAIGFKHGMGKDSTVAIEFGSAGPREAFVITHELGKAIVMPLRMDDATPQEEQKSDTEMTAPLPGMERSPLPDDKPKSPADGAMNALLKTVVKGGGAMTITTGGKSATITAEQAEKALKKATSKRAG